MIILSWAVIVGALLLLLLMLRLLSSLLFLLVVVPLIFDITIAVATLEEVILLGLAFILKTAVFNSNAFSLFSLISASACLLDASISSFTFTSFSLNKAISRLIFKSSGDNTGE